MPYWDLAVEGVFVVTIAWCIRSLWARVRRRSMFDATIIQHGDHWHVMARDLDGGVVDEVAHDMTEAVRITRDMAVEHHEHHQQRKPKPNLLDGSHEDL
jgi:hypothetical protein